MLLISISEYMRTAPGHIFSAPRWEELKRSIATGTMAGESPIPLIMDTKLALRFRLLVLTFRGREFDCQSGVWAAASKIKMQTVFGETTCANKAVASAYCPSGTVAIGGSYTLKSWSDGSNHNSPDSMALDPVNDRFYIVLPNNSKGAACFQAIANCATN